MGRGGHPLHHRDGEVVADVPGEEGWGEGVQSGGEAPVVGGGSPPAVCFDHPCLPLEACPTAGESHDGRVGLRVVMVPAARLRSEFSAVPATRGAGVRPL